ncbi:MAG TPA: hypothetical protein DCX96_06315 [Oscillibacter sp.]|nr:hypothetical protein [Oscillibacter sp.]
MNNKRATKRALLTSIMALVMCVVMLVGTTFAWFTDTASTGVNKIQAGNLDIQLLMRTTDESGNTYYKNIGDSHDVIFGGENSLVAQNNNQDTLWEPGKTQVAYLAVRNAGNLALKYNIILNVKDEGLIGALDYAIVPQSKLSGENQTCTDTIASWVDAKERTGAESGKLTAGTFTAAPNGCLDEIAHDKAKTNETEYFALVVHMDENAGNTYMKKSVSIDMKVVATQAAAEFDSFDNQYDKDAEYPIVAMDALQELINNAAAPVSAKLEGNIAGSLTVPQGKDVTLDLNGFTLTGGDSHAILNRGTLCIKDSSDNGKIVASKANTSALRNGDGAVCVIEGGTFTRAAGENNKWHTVENFGTMTFNGGNVIAEDGQSFAIVNGWNYINPGEQKATMTINNIEMKAGPNGFKNCAGGTLTMNGGTLHCTGYWGLSNDSTGIATINGGNITSDSYIAISNGGAKMEINGGTFTGPEGSLYLQNYAKDTVIKGGSYQNETVDFMQTYCPDGYTAKLEGGMVVVSKD